MRAAEVAFVGALIHQFTVLLPMLQEHLDDYDGLLPHVLLADVTRWILHQGDTANGDSDVAPMLDFLEASFSGGHEHERELIAVSFLENLPRPGEPGADVRTRLGPGLRRQLKQIG